MARPLHTSWILTLLALSVGLPPLLARPAHAGGFSNLDFGSRRNGMLAVTGRPDDATAIYHNPAGLSLVEGTQFYHQQTWAFIDLGLRYYDSQGRLRPDHELSPDWNVGFLPFFGFTSDLGSERWHLGLGIYAPNAYGALMPKDEPSRYDVTQALFIASQAAASLAYEVDSRLTVGVGLSLMYIYLNAQRTMSALVLQDPDRRFDSAEEAKPFDATLDLTGQDLTWGANVGLLLEMVPGLRFGASFTKGTEVLLEGDATLTQADGTVQKTRHHTTMALPYNLRAGLNWEPLPYLELGVDVYYWHYQVYQEQRSELDEPILGLEEIVAPKDYGNAWNWCVGMLYRTTPDLELMLGYQRDYTPIPESTFSMDVPLPDMHGVSAGARWNVSKHWRLGLAFVRNWYNLIDVRHSELSPPANAKGHGGNTEFSFDLSYGL